MNRVYRFFLHWPRWVLSGAAVVTLLVLTLMPADNIAQAPVLPHLDKVAHALMFGLVSCALLMDFGRARGCISQKMLFAVGAGVTVLGGIIEIAQQMMQLGRSGDRLDFAADAAGAFLLPLVFRPLLQSFAALGHCDLYDAEPSKIPFDDIKRVYMTSFPADERRPWADLMDKLIDATHPLNIKLIRHNGRQAGFITWWDFSEFRYVEHFAVDNSLRGRKIGCAALRKFIDSDSRAVILEVEPESMGQTARRRIAFYVRSGFTAHHQFHYVQPPYAAGLEAVELTLMTVGELSLSLDEMASAIRRTVYQCNSSLSRSVSEDICE